MQRRGLGMLLAAAAAFGFYKYRKMTPEQKKTLHDRGRGFLDKQLGGVRSLFGKRDVTPTVNKSTVHTPNY